VVGAGDAVKNGVERDDGDCWNAAIFFVLCKIYILTPQNN